MITNTLYRIALILRYFTEFDSFSDRLRRSGWR